LRDLGKILLLYRDTLTVYTLVWRLKEQLEEVIYNRSEVSWGYQGIAR